MYRSILTSICLIAFTFSFAQNQNTSLTIDDALIKAKEENKQVFVNYFVANRIASENMKKQLKKEVLKTILDANYIVVDIEVPAEQTSEYVKCANPMKSFNGESCEEIKFPFWYILNEEGNRTTSSFSDSNTGFSCTEDGINDFIEVIRDASELASTKVNYNNQKIASN